MLLRRTLLIASVAAVALFAIPATVLAADAASTVDTVLAGGATAAALDSPTMDQYNETNTDVPLTAVGGGPDAVETSAPAAASGGGAGETLDSAPARTVAAGGGLPFTGLPLAVVFGLGMTLTAFGLLLVLRGRKGGSAA